MRERRGAATADGGELTSITDGLPTARESEGIHGELAADGAAELGWDVVRRDRARKHSLARS